MKRAPRISIVTPCYNHGEFIEKTILSVLEQNYPNLEYIIIDGGSTDGSVGIIKEYSKHLAHWVSEKDCGQSHAINKGFQKASGEVLNWLNSDDCLEPGALEIVAEHAGLYPDAGAFVGHGRIVDTAGRQVYYREAGEVTFEKLCQWLDGGDFLQPSCFFRRSAWEVAGPLDENIHVAFDVDLWLKMVKQNIVFQRIDALLSTSLAHPQAKTTAFRNHMIVDTAVVVIKAGGERFVRQRLDDIATRLAFYEPNFNRIMNHPFVKLLFPLIRAFVKPATYWKNITPRW